MKKAFARSVLCFALALAMCLLAGCAGTPVIYYSDCTCPTGAHVQTPENNTPNTPDTTAPTAPAAEGALKTGLAMITKASKTEDANQVEYDVTVVAVTVDDKGVIVDCIIDSVGAKAAINENGEITTDLAAQILTKNELGDNYGMKAYGKAKYEWYEQAAALANYAKGKTVEQLRSGAVNESGKAADADLASTATIYLGGYVDCIEKAVANAKHLGAQAGDELKLAVINSLDGSANATAEKAGNAQLDCSVVALTVKDGKITSCYLDAVQAKVAFDATGAITTELPASVQTKNELGEGYGMKAWGKAQFEWNEQAASFAEYVTGKTAAEVNGIAVAEGKPSDADLSATVTIKIGDFQALIAKAMG